MRVPRIRQNQHTVLAFLRRSGTICAMRRGRGRVAHVKQPKREFWKPSRSLIDICHMRCDDEVRR